MTTTNAREGVSKQGVSLIGVCADADASATHHMVSALTLTLTRCADSNGTLTATRGGRAVSHHLTAQAALPA